jgi:hypothetical protein
MTRGYQQSKREFLLTPDNFHCTTQRLHMNASHRTFPLRARLRRVP